MVAFLIVLAAAWMPAVRARLNLLIALQYSDHRTSWAGDASTHCAIVASSFFRSIGLVA